ncbi:MAG: hypothetical protein JST30_04690 [Armatimonadetes bacterium]|nr:hypothetical protein [Armatimonadota bacterium]
MLSDFDAGLFVGVMIGEGHFGGDGRKPHVTLRMHVDHEHLFRWLVDRFPGSRLYGPYHHGGRHYYQWMARDRCLKDQVVPVLNKRLTAALDAKAYERFAEMKRRYNL